MLRALKSGSPVKSQASRKMPDLLNIAAADLALLESELPEGMNATLRDLAIATFGALLDDAEAVAALGKQRIAELALEVIDRQGNEVGGATFYYPKGLTLKLSPRDQAIYAEYTGRNKRELARKYGLSDMRIDQIYNKVRRAEFAKRQGKLDLS